MFKMCYRSKICVGLVLIALLQAPLYARIAEALKLKDVLNAMVPPDAVYLVNGQFPVPPKRHVEFPFVVNYSGTRLTGFFQAIGGAGNDIAVFIVDDNGRMLFQRGQNFFTYYSSGKISSQTIDIMLNPGRYYLVFSNSFSVVSAKTVQSEIILAPPGTLQNQ